MPLRSNTRFDDYQILDRIGAGGVGEGWRARDLRLKRDVTLRLLPRSFSFNPTHLDHFKHEAEAAAALNHPNIQSVLKVGEWEGAPYVVTEFLAGETLRARLDRGLLEIPNAVEIALQLARALAAAHTHCIIHRGLTPENVFLLKDEGVKILDFGVAKLTRPVSLQTAASAPGGHVIPGIDTEAVRYLSPEQLRGEQADARSDIFAFGAIFYELLTGRRAFPGTTVAELQNAILTAEPIKISPSHLALSPRISAVLEDCLKKAREDRQITASTVVAELEASQHAPAVAPVAPPREPPKKVRVHVRFSPWWLAAGMAAIILIVLVPFLIIVRGQSEPGLNGEALQVTQDGNAKLASSVVSDGVDIFFNETKGGNTTLVKVRNIGGQTKPFPFTVPMPQLAGITSDRSNLLVLSNTDFNPPLYEVSIADGQARKLSELAGQDAAFAPDGRVVFAKGKSLYIAEKDGSNPRAIWEFPHFVYNPAVSPDGQKIRLTVSRDFSTRTIWEVGLDGKAPHPLINGWESTVDSCCGRWTADGRYFVFQSRQDGRTDIWALTEEKRWLRHSELPQRLTSGPLSYELPFPSLDGEHLYAIGLKEKGELVRYDRSLKQFVPYFSGISATDVTVSSDGQWATYLSYPDLTIWRSRTDGSQPLQLTRANIPVIYPRISPDGTKVIFGSVDERGTDSLFVLPTSGGSPKKIAENSQAANWSPDSTSVVLFVSENPGSGIGLLWPPHHQLEQWPDQLYP